MQTALSTISVLPSEKLEVAQFARMLKSEILANDRDPLSILKHLKLIQKTLDDVLTDDDIDEHFLTEAEKYKEKTFKHLGCEFSIAETGVRNDFKECGDEQWYDLQKELAELKKKLKEREAFLKSIPYEGTVDPVNGNFLTKPTRTSKTKVTITL
ncbi:MAG TPA: hypothetical protein VMV77_09010 [Bacteroidales bacterium]|nr:hypothetical protein [Bacteroidales bacterium]